MDVTQRVQGLRKQLQLLHSDLSREQVALQAEALGAGDMWDRVTEAERALAALQARLAGEHLPEAHQAAESASTGAASKEEFGKAQQALEDAYAEVSRLEATLEAEANKGEEQAAEVSRLQQELSAVQEELAAARVDLAAAQAHTAELTQQLEALAAEAQAAQQVHAQVAALQEELQAAKAATEAAQAAAAEAQTAAAAAAAAAAGAVQGTAGSGSEADLQAQLQALQEELKAEREASEAMQAELDELRNGDVGSMNERITMLKELYDDEREFSVKVGGLSWW